MSSEPGTPARRAVVLRLLRREALVLVAVYLGVSAAWIALSDLAVTTLLRDPEIILRVSVYKGLGFVAFTAALLWGLQRQAIARVEQHLVEMEAREAERRAQQQHTERLEEQLQQAQKMEAVGRLAGGVAHDFNNVLSVILGLSDMLLQDLPPHGQVRSDVKEIHDAGRRAAELTRQLLAFSRQQVLQPEVLDLADLLQHTQKMLRRLLGEDVELTISTSPAGCVLADPTQMEQIVVNLAVNARDAMPGGGHLAVELTGVELDAAFPAGVPGLTAGRYVRLTVRDSGVGMDAATRSRIFEPFFTTKERGKGTGLGLSTVFGIVKQSHGHIEVESAPGAGTTFHVYLPSVDRDAPVADRPAMRPAPPRGAGTVLLVDDDDAVRAALDSMLRRSGYAVLAARGGPDALHLAASFAGRIDIVVTDVVMPRMNGRDLAEKLAEQRPEIKVLFLSGHPGEVIAHHGVLEPGRAFLSKPVSPDELVRRVREVLQAA